MVKLHRNEPLWFAHMAHRLSGVCLALFLPAHFYVLGLALKGAAGMDPALQWTANPLVKLVESGLVAMLAIHLFGGLRLIAMDFLPWSPQQKTYAACAAGLSFFIALSFLLSAVR